MSKTYIIGHQKPDTDSVVAVMALAHLYQQDASFGYENPVPAITNKPNPETKYLLDRFDVDAPEIISAEDINSDDNIVLVDHNEESQRLAGINQEQIVEIIDHHKLLLNLSHPIYVTTKPWGSINTIIYFMMQQYGDEVVQPDKKLASLMLAAILSDTVGFKSSTCTEYDRKTAKKLAEIAEITDLDQFTLDIFKAKSNLEDLTTLEIVTNDYKIFDFPLKTLIGQLETVEQEKILKERKKDLLDAMAKVKAEQKVEILILAITDILKVNTKLLVADEKSAEIAAKAFSEQVQNAVLDIGPKLSRKKDIAPAIEKTLNNK